MKKYKSVTQMVNHLSGPKFKKIWKQRKQEKIISNNDIPPVKMKKIPAFYFDINYLIAIADQGKERFAKAEPYPHVVINDFLPEKIANLVASEFPAINSGFWKYCGPGTGKPIIEKEKRHLNKHFESNENNFPPFTRHLMGLFNSHTFLLFLESLCGTLGLFPDQQYSGCGLHSTGRGGRLLIHTDQSRHPHKNFDQMLNLIYFTNKNWKEEYGGHLELWDKKGKGAVKKISPIFNRLVIFNTGTNTYHGHPYPLNCPENMRRNSLSVYYYVINRKIDKNYTHKNDKVFWRPTLQEDVEFMAQARKDGKIKKINGVETFVDPLYKFS